MAALLFVLALSAIAGAGVRAEVSTGSSPSRFAVEPRDTTVQSGRTARLECRVSSLADDQAVAWMKESTLQTSGRALLTTTDPEKLSQVTVEDGQSRPDLNFDLSLHDVRPGDAGVYRCYVVELGQPARRWARSKPARLTVLDAQMRPSVRCLRPTARQLADAARLGQPAPIGCTVLNNQPGMVVKLRNSHGAALVQSETNRAEPYRLMFQRGAVQLRTERLTCLIEFRDEGSLTGQATRSCSMGPFVELPPAGNRSRITVDLVSGSDAHLSCPVNEGRRRGDPGTGQPSWALRPKLPVSRYSLSPDGSKIVISRVTDQDEGLVVSCTASTAGGGHRAVDMEIRVRSPAVADGEADHRGQQVHGAGGERGRSAPKPVIGQAAWSVLRSRVSTGRLKPAPPSSRPGPAPEIHRTPAGDNPPTTAPPPTVPTSRTPAEDNATSASPAPGKDPSPPETTSGPVTGPPSVTLSPLIIVALCEAGMSLVILVIAFAVLCQCCCPNQTKAQVRGDKDLTLASASFGKQSTTPTLINYKTTTAGPVAAPGSPELSRKKLPPLPPAPEPIYARPESVIGGKKLLREADLPPTGSWVFSSVNSESGEAETNSRAAANEIYVTMV